METGNLKLSTRFITQEGFHLGQWVAVQKRKLTHNALDTTKVELLAQIGI